MFLKSAISSVLRDSGAPASNSDQYTQPIDLDEDDSERLSINFIRRDVQTQQDTNSQASILIDDDDEKGLKRKRSGKHRLSGGT
jgi:hypothetical protein